MFFIVIDDIEYELETEMYKQINLLSLTEDKPFFIQNKNIFYKLSEVFYDNKYPGPKLIFKMTNYTDIPEIFNVIFLDEIMPFVILSHKIKDNKEENKKFLIEFYGIELELIIHSLMKNRLSIDQEELENIDYLIRKISQYINKEGK